MYRTALTLDLVRDCPAAELAFLILPELDAARPFRRSTYIATTLLAIAEPRSASTVATHSSAVLSRHSDEALNLASALQHLVNSGLLVNWPPADRSQPNDSRADVYQLTPWGRTVQQKGPNAVAFARATRRLGVDLHETLAEKVRPLVAVGAFEQAALVGLRSVEARVRRLAGAPRSKNGRLLVGVPLMRHAFSPDGGPLADPDADAGENTGTMELFSGAFGAVRNIIAHTEVEWADSVEAAEYVLLADLLTRVLDRIEARID
ncbi:TIGR02391 family protein [Patulibacter sp. SYSU D01012]|uniref:TIGR02391 family protein n=1 Tax=Patulibacter sp. SYSU D01012 TaxID=2817381 RepID=UPI001B31282E|nr:TIGR02391 family protein [Patulibacter sp. SYSU D01012]